MEFQTITKPEINESLLYAKHSSGLDVYLLPKPEYTSSYAVITAKYGSIDNVFVAPGDVAVTRSPDGVAHFLEHKLFEKKDGNAFDDYAKTGASANAFTTFDHTSYLFTCTDKFYENLETLLTMTTEPYFTKENIEKEQGIIRQEINMYRDNASWRVFFNMLHAMYSNIPIRTDIAGTIESIKKIDEEMLYKCYNTFYHPSNMIFFAAGNIDQNELSQHIDKHFGGSPTSDKIQRIYPTEPDTVFKPEITQKLSVSTPLFNIGLKDNMIPRTPQEMLKNELVTQILLEMFLGTSSPLYVSMYESGLINSNFGFDYDFHDIYGFSRLGGESNEPEKVRDTISKNMTEFIPQEEDFVRIKNMFTGDYLRYFNNIKSVSDAFVAYLIKGINLFDYLDVINSITLGDIKIKAKEHFLPEKMVLSTVYPK